MKKIFMLVVIAGSAILYACNGGEHKPIPGTEPSVSAPAEAVASATADPKGIGKFTNVEVSATLDAQLAASGQKIAETKCLSCHKLTDEKLVGPGWKDVTKRRTPEWIMNFITNTDEMLNKDPEAMKQLEICLVRMPNQSIADEEARQLYEFMRKNDGLK